MKINHGYQDARAASAQDAAKAQEAAATQARAARAGAGTGKTAGADEVNLSPLASAIQSSLSDSPERVAFIERLAADFAAGNFQPDPQDTAAGLIQDALLPSPDGKKP
jgi:hypothetical protein